MSGDGSIVFLSIVLIGGIVVVGRLAGRREVASAQVALVTIPDFTSAISHPPSQIGAGVAIDPGRSKFAIKSVGRPAEVFHFSQLVAAEVERDGSSVTKTNRGSQAIGGAVGLALLGPAGLLAGAVTGSKRQVQHVSRLSLKLYTNDLVNPIRDIAFLNTSRPMPANSPAVIQAAKTADEWYARFRTILEMNQNATG